MALIQTSGSEAGAPGMGIKGGDSAYTATMVSEEMKEVWIPKGSLDHWLDRPSTTGR